MAEVEQTFPIVGFWGHAAMTDNLRFSLVASVFSAAPWRVGEFL
jgi:hypothetical protein